MCLRCVYLVRKKDDEQQGRFRLRKFATLTTFQGQGIGTKMLAFILTELRNSGASSLWCDARESALPFYKRFDFQTMGKRFIKRGRPYYKRPLHDVTSKAITEIEKTRQK